MVQEFQANISSNLSSAESVIKPVDSSSLVQRFMPYKPSFGRVELSGTHVFFQHSVEERLRAIQAITPADLSFADRVNRELHRISPYYEAIGLWVNFEHRALLLAQALNVSSAAYQSLLSSCKMNSVVAFQHLLEQAERAGLPADRIALAIRDASSITPKPTARQRMIMMKTIMNSTPVIVADLFSSGADLGSYGFGDGKAAQIFGYKTKLGDVGFSAIASPRLFNTRSVSESGYVFRFCVGKFPIAGFEEDHPLYMLDSKVVETLTAWHQTTSPQTPLAENPLLSSMAKLLLVSTHDWGHSWLLYDRDAQTRAFMDWGDKIYDVPHRVPNKLVINYELITASMHRYTWGQLFDNDPTLEQSIISELATYHSQVQLFASFVKDSYGADRAFQEENYLMYIALSSLPFVLDWQQGLLKSLLDSYPVVKDKVTPRLGPVFDILSANLDGVPVRGEAEEVISTGQYIRDYPLQEEIQTRLRTERMNALLNHEGTFSIEPYRAFAALPQCITNQFGPTICDPSIFPTLKFALDQLAHDLGSSPAAMNLVQSIYERIRVAPSGHIFFRLERTELDYERLVLCEQDKRVLLVKVPAGESMPLRQRISTSLLHEFTKQVTVASDQDMIAFNVQSQSHANEILQAAKGLAGTAAIAAMIDKGNEMSHMRSVQGAQDIYPLRRVMAEQLYGSSETGYHEVLGRKRFGCATRGPVELHLHDGSTQRTLAGVLVYVPPKEAKVSPNEDQDPDMHGIEAGAFDSTYLASAASMKPFYLRKNSHLTQLNDADHVSKALHRLIEKLNEINLQIDLGSSASTLAKGLFSQQ